MHVSQHTSTCLQREAIPEALAYPYLRTLTWIIDQLPILNPLCHPCPLFTLFSVVCMYFRKGDWSRVIRMYHVGSCPRRHENTQIGSGWRLEENSRDRSLPRLVPNPSGLRLTSIMIGFHIPINIIFFDSLNVYRTNKQRSSSEMQYTWQLMMFGGQGDMRGVTFWC